MSTHDSDRPEDRNVPGVGGSGSTDAGSEGQSALRLHIGICVVGGLLSAFVTVLFALVLGSVAGAVVFGVVTLACVAWGLRARQRLHRGRKASRS